MLKKKKKKKKKGGGGGQHLKIKKNKGSNIGSCPQVPVNYGRFWNLYSYTNYIPSLC